MFSCNSPSWADLVFSTCSIDLSLSHNVLIAEAPRKPSGRGLVLHLIGHSLAFYCPFCWALESARGPKEPEEDHTGSQIAINMERNRECDLSSKPQELQKKMHKIDQQH